MANNGTWNRAGIPILVLLTILSACKKNPHPVPAESICDTTNGSYISSTVSNGLELCFCSDKPYLLDATKPGINEYIWNTGDSTPVITTSQEREYIVKYYDTAYLMSDTVRFIDDNLIIPTAFSPDGDGLNDEFHLNVGPCIEAFSFSIYNHDGEKIFEISDESMVWDGTYKGKQAPAGDYSYIFLASTKYADTYEENGNISIVR